MSTPTNSTTPDITLGHNANTEPSINLGTFFESYDGNNREAHAVLKEKLTKERYEELVWVDESELDQDTKEKVTIPYEHLFRHTAAFGAAATGKSTHQHTVMQQLAENGHGFCVLNYRDFELDTLLERLPDHRHDDILHLDDSTQIYTADELEAAIETNQIIIVEHTTHTDSKHQQEFFAEFLTDYWNTIQATTSDNKHALFIDRFHQLAHTDNFDYPELLGRARSENLAVNINAMSPGDLPKPVQDAVFANCGNLLAHRTTLPSAAEDLADRLDTIDAEDLITLDQHTAYLATPATDIPIETALLDPTIHG